ncbi:hypothetical protein BJ742DRAFT_834835 [Cladochytrium replicatum]|nr:hypothetical protein BJ742DRAFT_834835 [Cladochytrium replicatum]
MSTNLSDIPTWVVPVIGSTAVICGILGCVRVFLLSSRQHRNYISNLLTNPPPTALPDLPRYEPVAVTIVATTADPQNQPPLYPPPPAYHFTTTTLREEGVVTLTTTITTTITTTAGNTPTPAPNAATDLPGYDEVAEVAPPESSDPRTRAENPDSSNGPGEATPMLANEVRDGSAIDAGTQVFSDETSPPRTTADTSGPGPSTSGPSTIDTSASGPSTST